MKYLKVSMTALAVMAALAINAKANTITVGATPTVTSLGPGLFEWEYSIEHLNGWLVSGESEFVIYDFFGYVPGSGFAADSEWVFLSASGTGPGTPNSLTEDKAGVANLHFLYVGPEDTKTPKAGPAKTFDGFKAVSTVSTRVENGYWSHDRGIHDSGGIGRDSFATGPTDVPSGIPEPGEWVLMGVGLCGMLIYSIRRRQQKIA